MEEDRPNGPNLGLSSSSRDACHVAHVGHDTGEAEMNHLSRFQHLKKMVKLTAMHLGLEQDSNPICSDTNDGSNPDWPPDDDQNHDDITRVVPQPPPPQKRRETDDPLCSENNDRVAKGYGIFFHPLDTKPDTINVDDSVAEYVSNYLYSTISDDSFKTIKESTKNPNINFLRLPC